jgi:hypothetical protein
MNFSSLFNPAYGPVVIILGFIINLLLAYGIYVEANKLKENNKEVVLLNGFVWFLLVLYSGVIGAALFWFVHHFKLK